LLYGLYVALQPIELGEDKFMVPYQQNKRFIGHKVLLELLKATFFRQEPKEHNHRMALYGLGRVGKTQMAPEYVYKNQRWYQHI